MTTQKQQINKNKTVQGPRQNKKAVQFPLLKFKDRKKINTNLTHCYNKYI